MVNNKTELLQLEVRLLMLDEERDAARKQQESLKRKLVEADKAKADLILRTIKMGLARTT
jgi:hypothetical protein